MSSNRDLSSIHHNRTRRARRSPTKSRYRGTTPEIRAVLQHVQAHGYTAELGRSNHWRIIDPAGHFVLALPLTPGSNRAAATARRALAAGRRAADAGDPAQTQTRWSRATA